MHLTRAFRHAGRFPTMLFAAALLLATSCSHVRAQAQTQTPVLPDTTGELKTAVILVNFSDAATQPKTRSELHNLVFGQVSDFFWENSYQKTFLSGDTFGWFTIPVTAAQCSKDLIAQEGNRAAVTAGANLSAYTHFIYLYPNASGCPNTASVTIGPNGEKRTFVNGPAGFVLRIVAHELGHAFGLQHSDALDCDVSPLGNTCSTIGYGDPADTMGGEGHFNAFQKERLGWLGAAGTPPVTTVSSNGRYAIDRYETTGSAPKALKVLKSTDPVTGIKTWYYIEYRQAIGFDALLAGRGNLTTGVIVRTGQLNGGLGVSQSLDMTPDSDASLMYELQDAALGVGRSFIDPASGVTISLAAADANGATIDVSFGGGPPAPTCTRATPVLSVTGPATAVAAGSTVNYTLSLTNKDSSACSATLFNLARSVPSGWSGMLAAGSLSLSPGTTSSTTLSVTSASNAAAGGYAVGVGVSSSVGSPHTANASATYSVATAPGGTLTGTVGTDKTSYLRGQTVYMSALVRSGGVAVSGATVKFNVALPGGSVTVLNATSSADGYARIAYRLGKGKGAIGQYTLRADTSSGSDTATASTGFAVN